MNILKQATASQTIRLGPFVDDSDGHTAETALTIANTDIRISKGGGAFGAKNSGGATHDEAGWYSLTLDATDTATIGELSIAINVAGALPVFAKYRVLDPDVFDVLDQADPIEAKLVDATSAGVNALLSIGVATEDSASAAASLANDAKAAAETLRDQRLTTARAEKLDRDLAHAADANTYKATGFSTHSAADVWAAGTRTLTAFSFAVETDAASRTASQANVSGLAEKTDLPTNFSSLGINATGHLLRVVLVDTTTENSDMRGTDNALLAANYTAPDNSGIGDAKTAAESVNTKLTTARAAALDNLDAAITTRSSHSAADVWGVSTRTLSSFGTLVNDIATAVWGAGTRTLTGLSAAIIDSIWHRVRATSSPPAGSYGEFLDAKVSEAGGGGSGSNWSDQQRDAVLARTLRVDGLIEDVGGDQFTEKALSQAPAGEGGGGGAGDGDVAINHNFGGEDALRYKKDNDAGIDNAVIRAYVQSEYDASTFVQRAAVFTDSEGRWVQPMMLNAGVTYVLVFSKAGQFGPDVVRDITPE